LNHDYPTDVLSFLLERNDNRLEGEIIVSADTALSAAPRYGWSAGDELLLYVIHGALHLVGYDDQTPEAQAEMRRHEAAILARFGKSQREDAGKASDELGERPAEARGWKPPIGW
jgi:probable rRNA maturation factor